MFATIVSLIVLFLSVPSSHGHGRLIKPPSRGSLWRFGFANPANYEDNELNCGGKTNQWGTNGGKCGLCGDPYEGPREHEAGGTYANAHIAGNYTTSGTMEVTVDITSNHKGYSEFRLCKNDDFTKKFTKECLDEHLLVDKRSNLTQLDVGETTGKLTWILQLPTGLKCSQCVLQWKYHTANSWGCYNNGNCCTGCGEAQEEFYGCSDIAIFDN